MAVASGRGGAARALTPLGRAPAARTLAPFYVANALTLARLASVPVLVALIATDRNGPALVLFMFAAATDGVDGFIARRFHGLSRFGRMIDPLADKFMSMTMFLVLALASLVAVWVAAVVIVRDLLLILGAVFVRLRRGRVRIEPLLLGKLATLMQFACIACALAVASGAILLAGWLHPIEVVAALATVVSALAYALAGIAQLRSNALR